MNKQDTKQFYGYQVHYISEVLEIMIRHLDGAQMNEWTRSFLRRTMRELVEEIKK